MYMCALQGIIVVSCSCRTHHSIHLPAHRSILSAVDEDTLVFVFGDHGMTETGDHGGETELETDSALLIYTPRPIFDPKQVS